MNANELADELENLINTCDAVEYGFDVQFEKAAAMIRQQHLEIMELRNSRDYWCLQYKDVMSKLDDMAGELMSLENSTRFEAGYGHN